MDDMLKELTLDELSELLKETHDAATRKLIVQEYIKRQGQETIKRQEAGEEMSQSAVPTQTPEAKKRERRRTAILVIVLVIGIGGAIICGGGGGSGSSSTSPSRSPVIANTCPTGYFNMGDESAVLYVTSDVNDGRSYHTIPAGDPVATTGKCDGHFAQVMHLGDTGWVFKDLID